MGEFHLRHVRRGRVLGEFIRPNLLHYDGIDYALKRMFAGESAETFELGIAGINCDGRLVRPNFLDGYGLPYDESTLLAEIEYYYSNEGGGMSASHQAVLGYTRKDVTFAAEEQAGGAAVATEEREFANAVPWTKLGDWSGEPFEPPDWYGPVWAPVHGYPWQKPRWKEGYWDGIDPNVSDMLTGNPYRGASFPVGIVFVASKGTPRLISSAVFTRCLEIRPGDSLYARYVGRVRAGPHTTGTAITQEFAVLWGRWAWANDVAGQVGTYSAALAKNPPGSLTRESKWADVDELVESPPQNEGYQRAPLSGWSKVDSWTLRADCAGFINMSPDVDWETVNYLVVYTRTLATNEDVLCWYWPLAEPITLGPGDSITFPPATGVKVSLRNGVL